MRRFGFMVCLTFSYTLTSIGAAENKPKAEDLFPDSTLVAILIPDLADARAAATKTRLADMYAQPEMQAFLAPALAQLKATYEGLRTKNSLLPMLTDVDAGLLAGEFAVAIYARPNDPKLPLGIVATIAPKDPEAFRRMLPENIRQLLIETQVLPLGTAPTDGSITFMNGRVIACMPANDIGVVLGKLKNEAQRKDALATTPGFTAVRGKLSSSAGWIYASPKNLFDSGLKIAHATQRNFDPFAAQSIIGATGVTNVNGFGVGVGFSSSDPICESYVSFSAEPKDDLFTLFNSATPISAEGMKIAAEDAPYVAGGYCNTAALLPFLKRMAVSAGAEAANGFDMVLAMNAQVFGFDIQKDFFDNLGGEMVVAQTAVDTGAPLSFMPGVVISIPAKNPAKVESCITKFGDAVAMANAAATNGAVGLRLKRLDHHGKTIYYLSGQVLAGPVAVCVMNGRLLIGTSYNAVCRGIDQLEKNTDILSNKTFQETIARLTGKPFDLKALPASFAYSIDKGSGAGALALTTLGLLGGTGMMGGLAELPAMPAPNAAPALGDIAKNEEKAIRACVGYAEAQEIYRRTDYQGKGVLQYAQALKGDHSLLENSAGKGDLALVDKAFADAEGEPGGKGDFHGYRFKILKSQGENALGGKRDYLVNGNMTLGYALLAYPAEYDVAGKRCMMISSNGTVLAKDLGAATAEAAAKITSFDPDKSWKAIDNPREAAEPDFGAAGGNDFEKFIARPSGKAVLSIASTIDLGLWPDEGFFMKYRRPTGSYTVSGPDGIYWRSELPPPGPASTGGINPMMVVSGSAIIAAIAIPSLVRSRMAANETAACASCKAFAEAEEIYHRTDYTGNGVLKYAQSLKDLYETKEGQGDIALLDRAFKDAEAGKPNAAPKAGYYFKVLTLQGPAATGGRRNYVVNGNMTLGYALVAYPAQYDSTGRDTFIINGNGTIFQKDLGAETQAVVEKMTEFNPDQTWIPTE